LIKKSLGYVPGNVRWVMQYKQHKLKFGPKS
jgi:hypothetical protein